jgi:hypothetical protein
MYTSQMQPSRKTDKGDWLSVLGGYLVTFWAWLPSQVKGSFMFVEIIRTPAIFVERFGRVAHELLQGAMPKSP